VGVHPIVRCLEQAERQAVIQTLAFMSFNPSIGRVLEAGSVDTFTEMVGQFLSHLSLLTSQQDFDKFHDQFLGEFMSAVKTAKDDPLAYGQAQKPLNVFLKVYVHWASLPSQQIAERVRPLLHVPLDRILMSQVKHLFPKEYHNIVRPAYQGCAPSVQLSEVDPDRYRAWQACFREISPDRPVLLDVLWNLGRSGGRASRKKTTGGGS